MQNNSTSPVTAAIEKLDRAVLRLERAANKLKPDLPRLEDYPKLEQKLSGSQRQNDILREAVGRVSTRLDHVIGRITAALK